MNSSFVIIEIFKSKSLSFFESIFLSNLKKINEKLEEKILAYESEIIKLKDLENENKILKEFFNLKIDDDSKIKVIIPKKTSINYVLLSKIKNSNEINVGESVISVNGYFGKITGKLHENLIILTANSTKSKIPVISEKSNLKAILFGKNSNYFEIKYVTKNENEIFVDDEELKNEFIDGEFLLTFPINENEIGRIKVAKIVKNQFGEISAEWVNANNEHKFIGIISKNKKGIE